MSRSRTGERSGALDRFAPGLASLLGYRRTDLRFDAVAGLSVAAVALPVGLAYSEIAQVPAVVGIYSAIFPLFAYALFGSSRQLMTGPDAATCMMAAAAIGPLAGGDPQRHAALMVALTLMTGLLYVVAGVARLGFIANFFSQPILVGYLNGIALIILVGQLPTLFGFERVGEGFLGQVRGFVDNVGSTHAATLALGAAAVGLLMFLKRALPRLPGPFIVAVAGIVAVAFLGLADHGVAVLGSVPAGFPPFGIPTLAFAEIGDILPDAAGITLVSFTSGVLTAKSFARRGGYDIDADQDLTAFGACNLASGLAQGFPVTGADSRTAVNDATGGRTQLVGIVAGVAMLLFLLFATGALALLPNAALAAIIVVSSLGLLDLAAVRSLWTASRRELLFSLVTTAGVILFGVLPGVFLAIALSLLWLLSVTSHPHDAVLGRTPDGADWRDLKTHPDARPIAGLLVYRFDAGLVFFNCDYFKRHLLQHVRAADTPVEWVILDARPINVVDHTALEHLLDLSHELESRGIVLAFANAKVGLLRRFFRAGWVDEPSRERGLRFDTLAGAVEAFEGRNRKT